MCLELIWPIVFWPYAVLKNVFFNDLSKYILTFMFIYLSNILSLNKSVWNINNNSLH